MKKIAFLLYVLILIGALLTHCTAPVHAVRTPHWHYSTTFERDLAEQFGRLYVYYNGRVCPLQTLALDFTRKVSGGRSYMNYTAEQVLTGWIFWPDMWSSQPFIRVKSRALRDYIDQALDERYRLADREDDASQTSGNAPAKKHHQAKRPGYYTLNDFFDRGASGGSYLLDTMVHAYNEGNHDALHRQVAELDGRIQWALELRRGSLLQIFPHIFTEDHSSTHTEAAVRAGDVVWYAPTDTPHSSLARDESLFIKKVVRLMSEQSHRKKFDEVAEIVDKIAAYQEKHAAGVLPSRAQVWAERTLSAYPWVSVLFVANLVIGLLLLVRLLRRLTARRRADVGQVRARVLRALPRVALGLLWLVLTWVLALRMIVTGHLPLSNGYETTLVIAWMVQLITLLACRRVRLLLPFGFLLSGFFLLVSLLN